MRRTAADAALTRNAILRSAHNSFAEVGFANSSLDAIAANAQVTRGAVHHHFGNKNGLFHEVFISVTKDVAAAVTQEAAKHRESPWAAFAAGVETLITHMIRPDFLQIAVADAPGVVGFTEWHRVNRAVGVEALGRAISWLHDSGALVIAPEDQNLVTLFLFGALTEGGLAASRPDGPSVAEVRDGFLSMVLRFSA